MDMAISLNVFKDQFSEIFLQLHWRHWASLGVSSSLREETARPIDLEALLVSTLSVGEHDIRLLSAAVEWIIENHEWINFSRVKRIGGLFTETGKQIPSPLINVSTITNVNSILSRFGRKEIPLPKRETSSGSDEEGLRDFQMRGVVTPPQIRKPSLAQLHLRGVFGINARAEVLLYLVANDAGNSHRIAKEIACDQKSVYRILERWAKTGLVEKTTGQRAGAYSLSNKKSWLELFDLGQHSGYINWIRLFHVFAATMKTLNCSPWQEDEYLLSSFFRNILNDFKSVGKSVEITFPDPSLHPGPDFFSPVASKILELLEKL